MDNLPPSTPPPSTPPPPPYNPYVAAQPAPAPAEPSRPGWSWRATVAGAVAGGVLAASVAVPVTWALNRDTVTEPAAGQTVPTQPQVPGQGSEGGTDGGDSLPQAPFGDQGGDQYGDQGGGSTSSQDQYGDQTDATADQSKGVVLIDTQTTSGAAAGSGLVIDSSGLVLTNYHVVEGSTEVKVTVASTGTSYDATVVGHDQTADIALLQLDGASDLATVDLDDDGDPAASDDVTAVGNAQGQGYLSASSGTVVALDQSIDTQTEGTVDGEHLTGLIQTDAYVVGGYSGGALLDDEGEVVGITTAASSGGAAESYAVPIDHAMDIADQIEDGDDSAEVQVGPSAYLGVAISQEGNGVQVGQVQSGGAAADAGVEAGATITGIDDTQISSFDALQQALAKHQPGDSVVLHWTDTSGSAHQAKVTLGESPVN